MSVNDNPFMNAIKYGPNRKIFGRNLLVKNVFDFFANCNTIQSSRFALCTNTGLILSIFNMDFDYERTGYIPNLNDFLKREKKFLSVDFAYDYIIVYDVETSNPQILEMFRQATDILALFFENESEYLKMLKSLDYLDNSLFMCDKEGNVTFANSTFCDNVHVENRDSIIGMHILDVLEQSGTQINAIETNSPNLKMMNVLKEGKPELDWAVRIESNSDNSFLKQISNDMFPTFDENGRVSGLVEISRSRQQEMKKTRKIMGLNAEYVFDDVIGNSGTICQKIKLAKEFAGNRGTVLITGESGVGKEIFAQAIHNYSMRKKGPFVALNCANFPAELIESELFGYVEGAFTGASKKGRTGKIELANGGTLFLDEIGELPYYFQSKLLRVLETWTITRIGGIKEVPVDVRLIAATNRNLSEMIQSGLFRQDLYYRLQVLTIDIPPLRERIEDVPLIAEHFLDISAKQNGHSPKTLSGNAKKRLLNYSWPGNARELKNVVSRIDLLYKGAEITGEAIDTALFSKENPQQGKSDLSQEERINSCKEGIDAAYKNLLNEALDITMGNKKSAAELLGISRKTIYRMLEKYNL